MCLLERTTYSSTTCCLLIIALFSLELILLNGVVSFILEIYEKALGQMLNKDKISIFFSRNTPSEVQSVILQIASVKSYSSFEKYLGLPLVIGRAKDTAFHSLLDRIELPIGRLKCCQLQAKRFS